MDKKITELATRIYNNMEPWERCDTTIEETAEQIALHPLDCIEYLLNQMEN